MISLSRVLTIFALLLTVQAKKADLPFFTHDELAHDGCASYIGSTATFCETKKPAKTISDKCLCKNVQALGTFAQCLIQLGNITSNIDYFLDNCKKKANTTITKEKFYATYENATKYFIDPKTTVGFNKSIVTYSPVKLIPAKSVLYYRSTLGREMNLNTSNYMGIIMMAYWGVVMVFAGIFNWTAYFFPAISNNSVIKKYREYLSLPAFHRTQSSTATFMKFFVYLIPNRLDTVLIGIWVVLVIAFQAGRYIMVFPNSIWTSKEAMVGRLVSDRSGITSLYCFPLLILFSGRNNFLNFITRWKYSRMIAIHRWVARVTVLLVFIHTVSMSASGVGLGKFYTRNHEAYVQWGWVAQVCGVIMLVQACKYLRSKNYEVFYLTHLLMAVFFTVGGWIHCDNKGYGAWYYAAVGVWCLERFLRICRLVSFGAPLATVELKAEETLRITIPKPSYWKPMPGQHAFVYFFRPSCFWQSHPFTIVQPDVNENKIRFYVKIKGGVTHGLYKYLASQPSKSAQIRVSVEGPYNAPAPLKRFENLHFIAGGNGIPGLFAEAMDLVRKNNAKQSIKFTWAIKHWKSLDWFAEELKQFENTSVSPIVYISDFTDVSGLESFTDSENNSETNSDTDEKKSAEEKTASRESPIENIKKFLPHVTFVEGRPDVQELVRSSINEASGSLAIVACAHPSIIDDARAAVVHNMSSTKNLVEFFDQMQVW